MLLRMMEKYRFIWNFVVRDNKQEKLQWGFRNNHYLFKYIWELLAYYVTKVQGSLAGYSL